MNNGVLCTLLTVLVYIQYVYVESSTHICDSQAACELTTINCDPGEDCTVTCSGHKSCRQATINCASDNECVIDCSGKMGCRGTEFNGENASQLTITNCTDGNGCSEATLRCPPKSNGTQNCIINVDSTLGNNLSIYAINGFNDIDSSGYYGGFPDLEHYGTMYCTDNYTQTCSLASNAWDCEDSNSVCSITSPPTTSQPTNNPTNEPTLNPTLLPTSLNPTNVPTGEPTNDLTNVPTNQPTNVPTKRPTNSPTNHQIEHTLSPTAKPTLIPTIHTSQTNPPTNAASEPTSKPTFLPTSNHPTNEPIVNEPTNSPTNQPTNRPQTEAPTLKAPQTSFASTSSGNTKSNEEKGKIGTNANAPKLSDYYLWIIIVCLFIGICFLCCVAMLYLIRYSSLRHTELDRIVMESLKINSVSVGTYSTNRSRLGSTSPTFEMKEMMTNHENEGDDDTSEDDSIMDDDDDDSSDGSYNDAHTTIPPPPPPLPQSNDTYVMNSITYDTQPGMQQRFVKEYIVQSQPMRLFSAGGVNVILNAHTDKGPAVPIVYPVQQSQMIHRFTPNTNIVVSAIMDQQSSNKSASVGESDDSDDYHEGLDDQDDDDDDVIMSGKETMRHPNDVIIKSDICPSVATTVTALTDVTESVINDSDANISDLDSVIGDVIGVKTPRTCDTV